MKLVLLVPPGAGKCTHAKKLSDKYNLPHISTGDIFRSNIKEGTELGEKAKHYIEAGQLVPDELTVDILIDAIDHENSKNGFILDGFPRTTHQAECLTEALKEKNEDLDYAINLAVPDELIESRMSGRRVCSKCGASYHIVNIPTKEEGICDRCGGNVVQRVDDLPETVHRRLTIYHNQTEPIIDYYRYLGKLVDIDATGGLEKVFSELEALLGD